MKKVDDEILTLAGVKRVSLWTKFKRRVKEIQDRVSWYVAVTLWLFFEPMRIRYVRRQREEQKALRRLDG